MKEQWEYVSTKVAPETYAVLLQEAKERSLSLRELIEIVLRAWLLGEVHNGTLKDSPESVAFVLRYDVS